MLLPGSIGLWFLMLIINADDWGRSVDETNAALSCVVMGRVTSVSAMVFMKDSERAAELAKLNNVDVGLHLNLSECFSGSDVPGQLQVQHRQVARFVNWHKYSMLFYNPLLREPLKALYESQVREFMRLFGKAPSHIDGHHHKHHSANMVLSRVIPHGERVRRNFSFRWGEKPIFNLLFRKMLDMKLKRSYVLTDHFISLQSCLDEKGIMKVAKLATSGTVELMCHPIHSREREFLLGKQFLDAFGGISRMSFAQMSKQRES